MDSNGILSLLGLSLRGGNLAVGEEPVEAAARARDARVLLVAADAADNTYRRVKHFADAGQCLWLRIPFTKAELGRAVGRSAAAVVAVTDIGLANAVVHKLAALDPVKYDEAAARLELKARRAAERRAEQLAHEKNVRTGKARKKAEPPRPEPPKRAAAGPKEEGASPKRTAHRSRPFKNDRPQRRTNTNPYAHSRPVKKGKGSFRKKEG